MPGHPDRRRLLAVEHAKPGADRAVLPAFRRLRRLRHPALGARALSAPGSATSWSRRWRRPSSIARSAPLIDAHGAGRRRITLHARMGTHEVLKVGFAAASSHDIIPVDRCPILDPGLNGALDAAWALAEPLKPIGKPLDIQVTATNNGLDVDVRGSGPLPTAHDRDAVAARRAAPAGAADAARRTGADARRRRRSRSARRRSRCRRARSCRPPSPARKRWRRWWRRIAGAPSTSPICSAASARLRLRLAAKARVAAFDSDAGAVRRCRRRRPRPPGLKPVKAEARDLFRRPLMPQELRDYDAVVFDPPRQGAQAQVEAARGEQGAGRGRGVLQRRDLRARRADPDRWRLQDRGRDAGRSVPPHAACRAGGAVHEVADFATSSVIENVLFFLSLPWRGRVARARRCAASSGASGVG